MGIFIKNEKLETGLLEIRDHHAMFQEAKLTVELIQPGFDFSRFDSAFEDVKRLFCGGI
jgi:hypothetical protein